MTLDGLPHQVPSPPAPLAAEIEADEAEAAQVRLWKQQAAMIVHNSYLMTYDCLPHQVRLWKQQAAMIVHLTVVPADDLAREVTIQLHADTPAAELPQICASALAADTTPAPDLPAVLASLSSKHALTEPDLVKLAIELGGDRSHADAALRLLSAQARLATSPATGPPSAAAPAAAAASGGAVNSHGGAVSSHVAARPDGAHDGARAHDGASVSPPDTAGSVRVRSGQLVRLRRSDPLHVLDWL